MKPKLINIGSRRLAVALVCLGASGLIAACGSASSSSSSTSTTTTASAASSGGATAGATGTGSARRAALVSCLKAHGVTLPNRPPGGFRPGGGAGGGGGGGGTGTGTGGGTGTGTGTSTAPRRGFFGAGGRNFNPKMLAAFKACGANFGAGGGFRGRISHTAITKFVTCVRQHGFNLPAPNFSGKGPIFPANIESNAKFQAASKSCQSLLVRPGGSASGAGTGGGAGGTPGA